MAGMMKKKTIHPDGYLSYDDRFTQVLTMLCKPEFPPPRELIEEWLAIGNESEELQQWVIDHSAIPWAQACILLDIAVTLADNPVEGQEDKYPQRW